MKEKEPSIEYGNKGATIRRHNKRVVFADFGDHIKVKFEMVDAEPEKPACEHKTIRGKVRSTIIAISHEIFRDLMYAYIRVYKRDSIPNITRNKAIMKELQAELQKECSLCGDLEKVNWKECGCNTEGRNDGLKKAIEIFKKYYPETKPLSTSDCADKCRETYEKMAPAIKDMPHFKYGFDHGFALAFKWLTGQLEDNE